MLVWAWGANSSVCRITTSMNMSLPELAGLFWLKHSTSLCCGIPSWTMRIILVTWCNSASPLLLYPHLQRAGAWVPELVWWVFRVCSEQLVLSVVCKDFRNLVIKFLTAFLLPKAQRPCSQYKQHQHLRFHRLSLYLERFVFCSCPFLWGSPQPTWLVGVLFITPPPAVELILLLILDYFKYCLNINGETKDSAWHSWKSTGEQNHGSVKRSDYTCLCLSFSTAAQGTKIPIPGSHEEERNDQGLQVITAWEALPPIQGLKPTALYCPANRSYWDFCVCGPRIREKKKSKVSDVQVKAPARLVT